MICSFLIKSTSVLSHFIKLKVFKPNSKSKRAYKNGLTFYKLVRTTLEHYFSKTNPQRRKHCFYDT